MAFKKKCHPYFYFVLYIFINCIVGAQSIGVNLGLTGDNLPSPKEIVERNSKKNIISNSSESLSQGMTFLKPFEVNLWCLSLAQKMKTYKP